MLKSTYFFRRVATGAAVALAACVLVVHASVPRGWFLAGTKPAEYEAGVDPDQLNQGLYRQKLLSAQPPFTIKFSPVEDLVGIHIVTSGHTRHRGPGYKRLFHDLSPLFDASTP